VDGGVFWASTFARSEAGGNDFSHHHTLLPSYAFLTAILVVIDVFPLLHQTSGGAVFRRASQLANEINQSQYYQTNASTCHLDTSYFDSCMMHNNAGYDTLTDMYDMRRWSLLNKMITMAKYRYGDYSL
jgi:hypothetical protein